MPHFIISTLFCSFLFFSYESRSQDAKEDSLLLNAHAIILHQKDQLEIFAKDNIVNKHELEVIVKNALIENINQIFISYNKFNKIEDVLLEIFDDQNKKLKTVKKKDFMDRAAFDGISIASDDRYLYYKIDVSIPKYRYKLMYTSKSAQSFQLGLFCHTTFENTAVMHSELVFINHDTVNTLRFNDHYWGQPSIKKEGKSITYNFEINHHSAADIKRSLESSKSSYIVPILTHFSMDNVDGSMESWASFGTWIASLNEGQDVLDDKTKLELKMIIGEEKDTLAMIEKLYKHLQATMRYVSISFGIGGFKPFSAQYVHRNKYGDCKALSNYMKAILRFAGVPSNYTLVFGGPNPQMLFDSVAINVFNHAILTVPLKNDTLFLECTSSISPTGYQGKFTGNRKALIIDGQNSKLVHTTKYNHTHNQINNTFEVDLTTSSSGIVCTKDLMGIGIEQYGIMWHMPLNDDGFIKNVKDLAWQEATDVKVLDRNIVKGGKYPHYKIKTRFDKHKKLTFSGRRTFIETSMDVLPNLFQEFIYSKTETVEVRFGMTVHDQYIINIPNHCQVEKLPKNEEVTVTGQGLFQTNSVLEGQQLIFNRTLQLLEGEHKIDPVLNNKLKKLLHEKIVLTCDLKP